MKKGHIPDTTELDERLVTAAFYGGINSVKDCLQNGADVNAVSTSGTSALHFASQYCDKNMIKLLIAKGREAHGALPEGVLFNVNIVNNHGETPLIVASLNGLREDIVELLIAKGADINHKDNKGETALHKATRFSYTNIIKLLKQYGAV